jgi:hypothetical protein
MAELRPGNNPMTALLASIPRRPEVDRGECPCCGADLSVHQPDPEWPDQLLGTCHECRSWFLLDGERSVVTWLTDTPRDS